MKIDNNCQNILKKMKSENALIELVSFELINGWEEFDFVHPVKSTSFELETS